MPALYALPSFGVEGLYLPVPCCSSPACLPRCLCIILPAIDMQLQPASIPPKFLPTTTIPGSPACGGELPHACGDRVQNILCFGDRLWRQVETGVEVEGPNSELGRWAMTHLLHTGNRNNLTTCSHAPCPYHATARTPPPYLPTPCLQTVVAGGGALSPTCLTCLVVLPYLD